VLENFCHCSISENNIHEEGLDFAWTLQYVAYHSHTNDLGGRIYGPYSMVSGLNNPWVTLDHDKSVEDKMEHLIIQ